MKTLFIFIIGLATGLIATHYYSDVKNEYFNDLYQQYSQHNRFYMTEKQFEKHWLSNKPWCFVTAKVNYCNDAKTLNPDNNEVHYTQGSDLVRYHQQLIAWYPKAQNWLNNVQKWAVNTWEKQIGQIN
jgi:hypothetical protein